MRTSLQACSDLHLRVVCERMSLSIKMALQRYPRYSCVRMWSWLCLYLYANAHADDRNTISNSYFLFLMRQISNWHKQGTIKLCGDFAYAHIHLRYIPIHFLLIKNFHSCFAFIPVDVAARCCFGVYDFLLFLQAFFSSIAIVHSFRMIVFV